MMFISTTGGKTAWRQRGIFIGGACIAGFLLGFPLTSVSAAETRPQATGHAAAKAAAKMGTSKVRSKKYRGMQARAKAHGPKRHRAQVHNAKRHRLAHRGRWHKPWVGTWTRYYWGPTIGTTDFGPTGGTPAVTTTTPPVKRIANVARTNPSMPTGLVRIVNRDTGLVIGQWRIELAGEFYKLKNESGSYAAIAKWARSGDEGATKSKRLMMLRHVADSGSPCMLWKIEPVGNGFWTITNCESKKCLIAPKHNPSKVVRQSTFREGALEQQWKMETVSP